MDDLTKLPDDYLPEIDDLPGELAQLAREIAQVLPDKQAVRLVLLLEQRYRGTAVYFHNADAIRRKVRNARIVERYTTGERVDDIARSTNMSSRHIWNILGCEPVLEDTRQMKLF
jgi:Mor family transcriptional regulator